MLTKLKPKIGYDENNKVLIDGMISDIADNPLDIIDELKKEPDGNGGFVEIEVQMPVWLKKQSKQLRIIEDQKKENFNSLEKVFDVSYHIIKDWIRKNPDSFPPLIINVSCGVNNFSFYRVDVFRKLMELKTNDGNVLIFNSYLSDDSIEVFFPNNINNLPNEYTKFLYYLSSFLPDAMIEYATFSGRSIPSNAKGFLLNYSPEIIVNLLIFGKIRRRAYPTVGGRNS